MKAIITQIRKPRSIHAAYWTVSHYASGTKSVTQHPTQFEAAKEAKRIRANASSKDTIVIDWHTTYKAATAP